ncbi:MAG TPA: hypothetical protein VJT82_09785 [Pyrinomonadaceae bacterium]|nr:hypothetical protein [Pyrinomonadaceae bacterium]
MAEQNEQHGDLLKQQSGDDTPSSDAAEIHRPRPAVDRQTEDDMAGQGLGQTTGATREDAVHPDLKG